MSFATLNLFLFLGNVPILVISMETVLTESVNAFLDLVVMIVANVSSALLSYLTHLVILIMSFHELLIESYLQALALATVVGTENAFTMVSASVRVGTLALTALQVMLRS